MAFNGFQNVNCENEFQMSDRMGVSTLDYGHGPHMSHGSIIEPHKDMSFGLGLTHLSHVTFL